MPAVGRGDDGGGVVVLNPSCRTETVVVFKPWTRRRRQPSRRAAERSPGRPARTEVPPVPIGGDRLTSWEGRARSRPRCRPAGPSLPGSFGAPPPGSRRAKGELAAGWIPRCSCRSAVYHGVTAVRSANAYAGSATPRYGMAAHGGSASYFVRIWSRMSLTEEPRLAAGRRGSSGSRRLSPPADESAAALEQAWWMSSQIFQRMRSRRNRYSRAKLCSIIRHTLPSPEPCSARGRKWDSSGVGDEVVLGAQSAGACRIRPVLGRP